MLSMADMEVLQLAADNAIIDLETCKKKVTAMKKKELLDKHPYSIWQGNDGFWRSYLPDDSKKIGRRLIKRKEKSDLEKIIIECYREKEENPTIKELYEEWVGEKLRRESISITTKNRYDRQFKECMKEFGRKRIRSIEESDIEEFILDCIHEYSLTQKGYSNLRTLIYGIFRKAKKKKYVNFSITQVIQDMELSKKAFRRKKQDDSTLVFSESEEYKIFKYIEQSGIDSINLGILLLFKTGLRPGEMAALKKTDIGDNYVSIDKTEIRFIDDTGKSIYKVSDSTKTPEGTRKVVIRDDSLWILDRIRTMSYSNKEWVFEKNGERLKTYNFSQRLETICKHLGIPNKSLNKIRKTYATQLIEAGIPDTIIIKQMGHRNISTTQKYYLKNRTNLQERAAILNSASGL